MRFTLFNTRFYISFYFKPTKADDVKDYRFITFITNGVIRSITFFGFFMTWADIDKMEVKR